MNALAMLNHFLDRAPWINRANTVDRVMIGDPQREVSRCLVAWIPSSAAIRTAAARGVNVLVAHEPLFYRHLGKDDVPDNRPECAAKAALVRETGMTIIRLHDTWDRWPAVGIPWAWAQFLGLGNAPAGFSENRYQHRYDIAPVPFGEFAARVAAATGRIGEPQVQVVGDAKQMVSHIGTGTGCACDIATYQKMGCDCSILCDDGSCYWGPIQYAADTGHCVIRVNHGTSEEPGMATLAAYLNTEVGVKAEHLPQGCRFALAGAKEGRKR